MIKNAVQIETDEKELIMKAKAGDKKAYEGLIFNYTNRLYAYLFRMTGNHQDAEDILQEALTTAYQNLHQFKGKSLFSTWLYRIAINICCKALRQRRLSCFYKKVPLRLGRDLEKDGVEAMEPADTLPDALKQTIENDVKQKIRLAISRLPRRLAEVVTLREFEGCDYEEISRRLDIPRGTVMSRLYRGRIKLAKILKKAGVKPE